MSTVICDPYKVDDGDEILAESAEWQLKAHLCETTSACLPIRYLLA